MLQTIKTFFSNDERGELFDRLDALRDEFEQRDREFVERIEQLETKPVSSLREIDLTRHELERVKTERDRAKTAYEIKAKQLSAQIEAAAPGEIDAAIRRLLLERERTAAALSIHSHTEKNLAGATIGFIDTNAAQINARVRAIDDAVRSIQRLKAERGADAAVVRRIEDAVPTLDVEIERRPSVAISLHAGADR